MASLLLSSVSSVDLLSSHAQVVRACFGSFQIHCSCVRFYVVIINLIIRVSVTAERTQRTHRTNFLLTSSQHQLTDFILSFIFSLFFFLSPLQFM